MNAFVNAKFGKTFNAGGIRTTACFFVLGCIVLLLSLWNLACGEVDMPFQSLLQALVEPQGGDVFRRILWELRIPRAVAAVLAGGGLAVAGLCLQAVFQNPLCGPFVLGISSGASLGVALALLAGFSFGHFGILGASSLGALFVTGVVMWIAARFERGSILLVAGLLMGYFIDAFVSILIAESASESLRVFVAWGMGSFGRLTFGEIWIFLVAETIGLLLVGSSIRYLNAARFGDDFARCLGVNAAFFKKIVLLGASILAGAATAFCGPVAFIGIAVPHLTFMLFKTTNHRILLPGCFLCGAVLALMANLFPAGVPLNAILSIIGVPVILFVLVRGSRRGRL